MHLTQTSQSDYDELCRFDILGLSDSPQQDVTSGPVLQNNMWNILVRSRVHPVAVNGAFKKAILQVRGKEEDRNALRFHWQSGGSSKLETLWLTRVIFGLTSSPFLLGEVIEHHLNFWESRKPETVEELRKTIYVDDLVSGGDTVEEAKDVKQQAIEIF